MNVEGFWLLLYVNGRELIGTTTKALTYCSPRIHLTDRTASRQNPEDILRCFGIKLIECIVGVSGHLISQNDILVMRTHFLLPQYRTDQIVCQGMIKRSLKKCFLKLLRHGQAGRESFRAEPLSVRTQWPQSHEITSLLMTAMVTHKI